MPVFTAPQQGSGAYQGYNSILDENPTQFFLASDTMRPKGNGPDILSASQYPQVLMQPYTNPPPSESQTSRKRKARTASSQLYGGLYLAGSASEETHSSSAEQDQPPSEPSRSSKRPKSNDGDDQVSEKKQRGRPRLDTHDETAADRRRTQIRLAQRAYRHRKETTISALKKKVTDLQNTIEQMNKTFLTLHDNIIDAGILSSHYSLGRQLQGATEEFVTLSKIATVESDDEEEAAIAALTKDEEVVADAPEKKSKRSDTLRDSKPVLDLSSRKPSFTSNTNARQIKQVEMDFEEIPRDNNPLLSLSDAAWTTDNSNIHDLNDVLSFNVEVPDVPLFDDPFSKLVVERPLKPNYQPEGSYTYSFQETTFARRLHRMCLERAFRNLTNPQIDPYYVKRTFRFTFCFSNRKRMLQRFQDMLKRKAGESLENWNIPFFHIGGAGTHFPRRDNEGNAVYPPNLLSPARAFGPYAYVEPETPRNDASLQETLEKIGFGGVWFDSHDVEEYLKTKGIYLDGQSSFVEVHPSVLAQLKMSSLNSETTSSSDESGLDLLVRTPSPPLRADTFINPSHYVNTTPGIVEDIWSQLSPIISDNTVAKNSFPPTTTALESWKLPAANDNGTTTPPLFNEFMSTRAPLTFDVEAFLERMLHGSACLGRAPGFRKEMIDKALMLSLQESF
jgi:hypothetical protein